MLKTRASQRGQAGLKITALAVIGLVLACGCKPGAKAPQQVAPLPVAGKQAPTAGKDASLPAAGDTLFKSETYSYSPEGSRDPFKPIVQKKGEGSGENSVGTLDISNIALTGIIEGPSGKLALVHDNQGVGYVIQEGDQLIGGRLVAIKDTNVIFRQEVEKGRYIDFSLPIYKERQDLKINQ